LRFLLGRAFPLRISLRYRLLLPLAALLVIDAALTWWAASVAADHAETQVSNQLAAVARTLTEPPTFPLTLRVLEQMSGLSGAEFALQKRNAEWVYTFPLEMNSAATLTNSTGPIANISGQEYRIMRLPLRAPHPNEGGTLFICYPEALRRTAIRDAVRPTLLLGLLGGFVGCVLTLLASSRLVTRIRALDHRTRAMAAGDWQPMPLPRQKDELQDLTKSVNELAQRLAEFEQQLKQTERLRVLGQFSGGLAHQLRNAAAGARLALQLALADTQAADREPLEVALRQLARIETNLRQFLDLGTPPTFERRPCDLRNILEQVVETYRPRATHAGVQLKLQRLDALFFEGDLIQLNHIFTNLVGNALDAVREGGIVNVNMTGTSEAIQIDVIDDGPGPPPDIAERLFDAFTTGREQGIGLGLTVAKNAVEAHGGSIAWQREQGKTIFRVQLPAHHASGSVNARNS